MAASKEKQNYWTTLIPTIKSGDFSSCQFLVDEYKFPRSTSNVHIKYPQHYCNLRYLTGTLSESATTSQRLWHIKHSTIDTPTCIVCGNATKWQLKIGNYSTYCSSACVTKNEDVTQKRKITNIDRYGVPSYTMTDMFRAHMSKMSKIISNDETIKAKKLKTCREKYGFDFAGQSEYVKNKTKETCFRKYGVSNYSKSSQFIKQVKEANQAKYGKDFHFQQHIPDDVLVVLNSYDSMFDLHITQKKSCVEISNELNISLDTVFKRLCKHNIKVKRYECSYAQKEIYRFLRQHINCELNNKSIITPYEIDIYIPDKKLAIEFCGLYWHCELHKDKNYHKMKYELCKNQGIQLITIFEDEWTNKTNILKKFLLYKLGGISDKLYARKCNVTHITPKTAKVFINENHIQGFVGSSKYIGLTQNNELVAIMSYTLSNRVMRIDRYCTSTNVVGGFTKLLKHATQSHVIDIVETFSDLRYSSGALYELSGFNQSKIVKPDYQYIVKNTRKHKFNFRHKQLKTLLKKYDPNLSEHENCFKNGIYKVYDCGKIKFTYKK